MARAFLIVMDSVGIGGAPDAGAYFNGDLPDTGANTLGHILGRFPDLALPNLARLGLWQALDLASGIRHPAAPDPQGLWGCATEHSRGKDTPSGHWELAGLLVPWDWHYFPKTPPSFPEDLRAAVAEAAGVPDILGNCHASGTEILERLGAEHLKTGAPICYTSVDSVFQIAAHEQHFGLDRLIALCAEVAPMLHKMRVGRVIARPFLGDPETGFQRTSNRRDFAITPPSPLLTNWVQAAGRRVHAVGKIGDILSMQGIDTQHKGPDTQLMQHMVELMGGAEDGSLTFANFVEFDSLYGHRRDAEGYARHLEWFDAGLGRLLDGMRAGDVLMVTADHGNDPTWPGTDHTRERVPVLVAGQGAGRLGHLNFADVGVSLAAHLGVPANGPGRSFL